MCVQVVCGEDALHKRVERENEPLKQKLEQVPFAQYTLSTLCVLVYLCTLVVHT